MSNFCITSDRTLSISNKLLELERKVWSSVDSSVLKKNQCF